jgi:hypothetical protein
MGLGEETMKTWSYVSSIGGFIYNLFVLVFAVLVIMTIKGNQSDIFENNVFNLSIVVILLGSIMLILTGVGFWKTYQSHVLYLQVTSEFSKSHPYPNKNSSSTSFSIKPTFEPPPRVPVVQQNLPVAMTNNDDFI